MKNFLLIIFLIIFCGYLFINKKRKNNMIIGFTGDVMIGRLVNQVISEKGYSYPWGNILQLLHKNDLNIINLETTLTKSEKKVTKVFNFKSDPDKVQTLIEGKIDVVNLANNHILDFNQKGFFETLKILEQKNIKYVGVGKNIDEARKPIIIKKDKTKIGIIGYTNNEPGWIATKTKPGINYIEVGNIEKVINDIKDIKTQVDLLILSIHWGPNKIERPTKEFINFAHQMIDAGVDIIHGHSAHIFQGIEIYKNKIIMYSTGDFVDDYMVYPDLRNDHSFLFRVKIINSKIKNIELVPVIINNMQVNLAKENEAQEILNRMKMLCSEFKTKVEIKNKKGFITIY
ncbi:CapA family protein [Candidatus Babeliales bacterium]|nr:CapA family protein [Candidatus Babeliales bacterium]